MDITQGIDEAMFNQVEPGNEACRIITELAHQWVSKTGEDMEVAEFFTSNTCPSEQVPQKDYRKRGYLNKKGKTLGGWKLRYYQLDNSAGALFYGESPSMMLGPIVDLNYAMVARLPPLSEKPSFALYQYKKTGFDMNDPLPVGTKTLNTHGLPDGKVSAKFILYAETVQERDDWVRCIAGQISRLRPNDLFNNNELESIEKPPAAISPKKLTQIVEQKALEPRKMQSRENLHRSEPSNESTLRAGTPTLGKEELPDASMVEEPKRPSVGRYKRHVDDHQRVMEHAMPRSIVTDAILTSGNEDHKVKDKKKGGKRFTEFLKKKEKCSLVNVADPGKLSKPIFGVSLEEAVAIAPLKEYNHLPSVIFRCIEYLEVKQGN